MIEEDVPPINFRLALILWFLRHSCVGQVQNAWKALKEGILETGKRERAEREQDQAKTSILRSGTLLFCSSFSRGSHVRTCLRTYHENEADLWHDGSGTNRRRKTDGQHRELRVSCRRAACTCETKEFCTKLEIHPKKSIPPRPRVSAA